MILRHVKHCWVINVEFCMRHSLRIEIPISIISPLIYYRILHKPPSEHRTLCSTVMITRLVSLPTASRQVTLFHFTSRQTLLGNLMSNEPNTKASHLIKVIGLSSKACSFKLFTSVGSIKRPWLFS